jgi:hypothetical protein
VGLASVFNDNQMVAASQFENGIHVYSLTIDMNRDHSRDRSVPFPVNGPSCFGINLTFPFKVLSQLVCIEPVGALVDIHEIWSSAGLANSFRGRNKGVGHGDNHITGSDTGGHQCEADSVSSARDSNAVRCVTEKAEFPLKLLYHRTANKTGRFEYSLKNRDQFFLKSVVETY